MPFTVKEFPGQRFSTVSEYEEALRKRKAVERSLVARSQESEEITKVTAIVLPLPKDAVERRMAELETKVSALSRMVSELLKGDEQKTKEGLPVGTVLWGESKGQKYTLEALKDGYLCSDGKIYDSLSGAALGVSGNRRSGWKFWRDKENRSIGDATQRFCDVGNSSV